MLGIVALLVIVAISIFERYQRKKLARQTPVPWVAFVLP